MAETEFDPQKEGHRVAANYLSSLGWAREWRRTVTTEIRSAWSREEMEAKFRRADAMEEEAEAVFSREFDRWRKDPSPEAKQVLSTIYEVIKNRHDLGFFGKRIVEHLKRMI